MHGGEVIAKGRLVYIKRMERYLPFALVMNGAYEFESMLAVYSRQG